MPRSTFSPKARRTGRRREGERGVRQTIFGRRARIGAPSPRSGKRWFFREEDRDVDPLLGAGEGDIELSHFFRIELGEEFLIFLFRRVARGEPESKNDVDIEPLAHMESHDRNRPPL